MPEARVFRPRSEKEDNLITKLMELRTKEEIIPKPSWTMYVSYMLNKEIAEVRSRFQSRTG